MKKIFICLCVCVSLIFAFCSNSKIQSSGSDNGKQPFIEEIEVQEIKLTGPITNPDSEVSGLAWYKDFLILMPQYPDCFKHAGDLYGKIFAIPRQEIMAYLSAPNQAQPILPREIDIDIPGSIESLDGYEGFEALDFFNDRVFLTIETSPMNPGMKGYVVRGFMEMEKNRMVIESSLSPALILPQADIGNFTDETILVTKDRVITIYEGNGKHINPNPVAHVFDHDLKSLGTVPFPTLEYRITDATRMDKEGRFWAINYLWPGEIEKLKLSGQREDNIARYYGLGFSHARSKTIERLIEFRYTSSGIQLIKQAPIYLKLQDETSSNNWEGLVRLANRGFLVVTDKEPITFLGFVSYSQR